MSEAYMDKIIKNSTSLAGSNDLTKTSNASIDNHLSSSIRASDPIGDTKGSKREDSTKDSCGRYADRREFEYVPDDCHNIAWRCLTVGVTIVVAAVVAVEEEDMLPEAPEFIDSEEA